MCKLLLSQSTPPWTNAAMQHGNATKSKIMITLLWPVRPPAPGG
jgi:hypothetical protein